MSFLNAWARQDLTHWAHTGNDGFGKPSFATPVALKGAWEDKTELVRTNDGSEKVYRSRVFLSGDVEEGDFLFLGTSNGADPLAVSGTRRILAFHKTKDPLANRWERVAFL